MSRPSAPAFQTPPGETATAVETALKTGYRHIDTAAAYGNERGVGEGLRRAGLDRDEVFLETKVWVTDYGYDQTLHAFDNSAAKLGVDVLDLLILHQPMPQHFERTREAYRGLEHLLAEGRVRAIGVSNFMPATSTTSWTARRNVLDDPTIAAIAARADRTPAQVMLRWHLQQGRSAIPKPTTPSRIAENFDIVDFTLTGDELAQLDGLDTGRRGGPDPDEKDPAEWDLEIPEA